MLLKSSSTPVLGSLLPSFTDSPNNNGCQHHEPNSPLKHNSFGHNKISFPHHTLSCSPSPSRPDHFSQHPGSGLFRRAQSEGNLEALAYSSSSHSRSGTANSSSSNISGRHKSGMKSLETIPSFAFNDCMTRSDEEEDEFVVEVEDEYELESRKAKEEARLVIDDVDFDQDAEVMGQCLFLARGLGVDGGYSGSGGGSGSWVKVSGTGGDGGDNQRLEEYYKKMFKENPSNALFIRNYADFLYQIKQDFHGAQEYYSRAILLDPNDGDALSQYAQLLWQLYGDEERASIYFERSVNASPENSHVHAAYASFLWNTQEEEEDGCDVPKDLNFGIPCTATANG